jgi:hypothetical protein
LGVTELGYEFIKTMMLVCPLNPPILGDFQALVPLKLGGLGGQKDSDNQQVLFFLSYPDRYYYNLATESSTMGNIALNSVTL